MTEKLEVERDNLGRFKNVARIKMRRTVQILGSTARKPITIVSRNRTEKIDR